MRYESTRHEYVFRHVRNGNYYFRGTVDGVFVDRSLKTEQITLAKTRADAIRKDRGESVRTVRHTFDELFDLVLKLQKTKGKETYNQAKTQVDRHLRPWFSANCPRLVEFEKNYEEKWAEYKTAQAKKKQERKLGHDRRYLVMALIRAHNKGWVRKLFEKENFDLNEAYEPIGQALEDEDVKLILKCLLPYPKIYLQVLIAVQMGMRISEILHLRKEEVDLTKREINLDPKRLKIRRARQIPIPISDEVYPRLSDAYKAAPGDYLFPAHHTNKPGQPIDPDQPQDDNRHHWEWVRELTGIEIRFHDLRHTAITNALAAGLPMGTASKIFGATMQTINRIYDHLKKDTKIQFSSLFKGRFTEDELK